MEIPPPIGGRPPAICAKLKGIVFLLYRISIQAVLGAEEDLRVRELSVESTDPLYTTKFPDLPTTRYPAGLRPSWWGTSVSVLAAVKMTSTTGRAWKRGVRT
jgi:hypothetical protein